MHGQHQSVVRSPPRHCDGTTPLLDLHKLSPEQRISWYHCTAVRWRLSYVPWYHLWRGPTQPPEGPCCLPRLGRDMEHKIQPEEVQHTKDQPKMPLRHNPRCRQWRQICKTDDFQPSDQTVNQASMNKIKEVVLHYKLTFLMTMSCHGNTLHITGPL